jgi:hypothetical protein
MLVARWQIDARFGHKQTVIDSISRWSSEIAPQIGLLEGRLQTGSIGALEATVEHNWEVESLAELEQIWKKLGAIEAHKQWSKDLEPFVVSGTARWSVFRVVEP